LVSIDDYNILGFRPVSSRTYLAVRMTGIVVQSLLMIGLGAVYPIAALLLKHDGTAWMMFAAVLTVWLSAAIASLGSIAFSTWLMLATSPHRLKRVVSYTQTVVTFVLMAGYFFSIRLLIDEKELTFA